VAAFTEETSTTTGTGEIVLAGATADHDAFGDNYADGQAVLFGLECSDGSKALYYGSYNSGADSLTRGTLLSSTGDFAASLPAGTHRVYVALDESYFAEQVNLLGGARGPSTELTDTSGNVDVVLDGTAQWIDSADVAGDIDVDWVMPAGISTGYASALFLCQQEATERALTFNNGTLEDNDSQAHPATDNAWSAWFAYTFDGGTTILYRGVGVYGA